MLPQVSANECQKLGRDYPESMSREFTGESVLEEGNDKGGEPDPSIIADGMICSGIII